MDWLLHMMNRHLLDVFFLACGDDGLWDRDGISVSGRRGLLIEPLTPGPRPTAKMSGVSSNISSAEENQDGSHNSHQERRGERRQDVNCTMSPVKESAEAVPQVFFFSFRCCFVPLLPFLEESKAREHHAVRQSMYERKKWTRFKVTIRCTRSFICRLYEVSARSLECRLPTRG